LKWAFLALLPLMGVILLIPKSPSFIYAGMAATLSFALIVFFHARRVLGAYG